MCGRQAFFISVNSKQPRCVNKITQCIGFVKKAEESRQSRMSKEDRLKHMKKMSEKGNDKLKELHSNENWRKQKGKNISNAKSTIPINQRTLWAVYENIVDRITRENWIYHQDKINPLNLERGKEFELDHKFSKHQGFLNKVSPEVIGHYTNLELLSKHSNRKKHNNCSITLTELLENFKH
jgi:hypothetical protein